MCKDIFIVNGYPLDEEQKQVVLDESDQLLVNAGAGSGKTLTMIGKIRYLIEIKKIKKEEILCISFTNEAVKSLKEKLLINYNYDLEVYTFHKLALTIIESHQEINIIDEYLLDEIINNYQDKLLIKTFINLYKSQHKDKEYFKYLFKHNYSYKNHQLLKTIYKIYYQYQQELNNSLDFNEMIHLATNLVSKTKLNYKYIIIDEYQDTSQARFNLINEIVKYTNSKLVVVGDDFQSIYRFTGCDLSLFLDFKKYYPNSKTLSITNTYRNSQELINVAGSFVMKNKYQIKKQLKSNKTINKPIKIIYTKDETKSLKKLLEINKNQEVMIIGRNNNDLNIKLNNNHKYLTAHKSKGLESDITILINLTNKNNGFPNQMNYHPLINKLLIKAQYKFDEERRLFYVALTRTKSIAYIIVNKTNQSIFIKEILKNYKKYIEIIRI